MKFNSNPHSQLKNFFKNYWKSLKPFTNNWYLNWFTFGYKSFLYIFESTHIYNIYRLLGYFNFLLYFINFFKNFFNSTFVWHKIYFIFFFDFCKIYFFIFLKFFKKFYKSIKNKFSNIFVKIYILIRYPNSVFGFLFLWPFLFFIYLCSANFTLMVNFWNKKFIRFFKKVIKISTDNYIFSNWFNRILEITFLVRSRYGFHEFYENIYINVLTYNFICYNMYDFIRKILIKIFNFFFFYLRLFYFFLVCVVRIFYSIVGFFFFFLIHISLWFYF